jgi:hypothetical protein
VEVRGGGGSRRRRQQRIGKSKLLPLRRPSTAVEKRNTAAKGSAVPIVLLCSAFLAQSSSRNN